MDATTSKFTMPSISAIQDMVARHFKVSRADMLSHRRTEELTMPRHVAAWLSRQLTANSLPAIGRMFGGRDHTTVLASCRVVDRMMADDAAFASQVYLLERGIVAAHAGDSLRLLADLDAQACGERVAFGGARSAMALSTLEIVAVCVRLQALEEMAAGAATLLLCLDRLHDTKDADQRQALADRIKALTETVAGALEALGYCPQEPADAQEQKAATVPHVHAPVAAE